MRTKMMLTAAMAALALLSLAASTQAATVSGAVTDGAGGPGINKALVVLVSGNSVAASGQTSSGGQYSLKNVANGRYTMIVSASGYASKVDDITVNGDASATVALVKLAKSDFRNLGRIVGFAKTAGNKPVPNAVLLLKKGNTYVGAAQPENATGVYELEWYPPGSYTVLAVAPGYNTASYGNQQITAGESLWLDVVLQPK